MSEQTDKDDGHTRRDVLSMLSSAGLLTAAGVVGGEATGNSGDNLVLSGGNCLDSPTETCLDEENPNITEPVWVAHSMGAHESHEPSRGPNDPESMYRALKHTNLLYHGSVARTIQSSYGEQKVWDHRFTLTTTGWKAKATMNHQDSKGKGKDKTKHSSGNETDGEGIIPGPQPPGPDPILKTPDPSTTRAAEAQGQFNHTVSINGDGDTDEFKIKPFRTTPNGYQIHGYNTGSDFFYEGYQGSDKNEHFEIARDLFRDGWKELPDNGNANEIIDEVNTTIEEELENDRSSDYMLEMMGAAGLLAGLVCPWTGRAISLQSLLLSILSENTGENGEVDPRTWNINTSYPEDVIVSSVPFSITSHAGEGNQSCTVECKHSGREHTIEVDVNSPPFPGDRAKGDENQVRRNLVNVTSADNIHVEENNQGPEVRLGDPKLIEGPKAEFYASTEGQGRSETIQYQVHTEGPRENAETACTRCGTNLDDGKFFETVEYDETADGKIHIGLWAMDQTGLSNYTSAKLDVEGSCSPINPSISMDPSEPELGEWVTFRAHPTRDDLSYEWSGDVDTSGHQFETEFEDAGEKTITLTITDACGKPYTATRTVNVEGTQCDPPHPEASITGPSGGETGEWLTFHATSSEGDDLSYDWHGDVDTTGGMVETRFDKPGEKTIKLTVTDRCDREDTETRTVDIEGDRICNPSEPDAAISGRYSGETGESLTFNGEDSVGEELTYVWTGDGIEEEKIDEEVTVSFEQPGLKSIRLDVIDACDSNDSEIREVDIDGPECDPAQPEASISGPLSAETGEFLTFRASGSEGEDLSYDWHGDVDSTGDMLETAFSDPGEKTIKLTVTDACESEDTETRTVDIKGDEPECQQPEAVIDGPDSADPEEMVTFYAYESSGKNLSYEWHGDIDGEGKSVTKSFNYGNYDIKLTVTDECGQEDTAEHTLNVNWSIWEF